MAKKLLSPELSQVIKDIENTREAINEKYALNGSPDPIPNPLLSSEIAEAVRKIQTVNELPVLDGTIELTHDEKEKELSGGYYRDGIFASLQDYAVSYIWNRQGIPAKTQYVKIDESFQIPDFGITEVESEEFQGWSHMPNDEDPEYLTGDIVNHFQYEPRLADPSYVSYLYAVWKLLKLDPIELSFEYANGGMLNSSGKEIVKMKVNGQRMDYPNLKRTYEVEGKPEAREDVEMGDIWYKHQFTFNDVGIFPVIVTHTGKSGDPQIAAGVMKIAGSDGSMGGNGQMDIHTGIGSWYDSGWIAKNIMKGCYISGCRLEAKMGSHSGGHDAFCIFIKKTNGKEYILHDFGITEVREVDLTTLGTSGMCANGGSGDIVLGNVILNRNDLGSVQHYAPGPNQNNMIQFTKADDVRQVRFFIFSSHASTSCFNGSIINYDIDYEFDFDLWESDKGNSGGGSFGGTTGPTTTTPSGPTTSNANPVDMRIASLQITPGILVPAFDKDVRNYTFTVPIGTTTIDINGTVVDARAQYKINNDTKQSLNLIQSDGTKLTKIEIDVSAKPEAATLQVINSGKYTIVIEEEKQQVTPPSNPNTPSARETATILLPKVPQNFSDIPSGSCIENKYGYWELAKQSKSAKLREAYVRIYNMLLNNGEKVNGVYEYSVKCPDGTIKTNLPVHAKINSSGSGYSLPSDDIKFVPSSNNPKRYDMTYNLSEDSAKKYISVYLYDLELTSKEIQYVFGLVMEDCPELMFKFQSTYLPLAYPKQMVVDGTSLTPSSTDPAYVVVLATEKYFKESTRQTMMQTCVDTLNEINKEIENTYGILFSNSPFDNNNKLYTAAEMVKVGKVIHDYLEAYNIYGREGGHHLNQTMYPALSRGKWNPVCASYARAFQYCCWRWGIISCYVSGICDSDGDGKVNADAGHAWNIVAYQNQSVSDLMSANNPGKYWQEVDCTWDDGGPSCGFDYGSTKCSDLDADVSAITMNSVKTTGWNDTTTCRWAYFNLTTADILANKPNIAGTSGGAGCRQRDTSYKNLVKGTCKQYTYNGTTLYGGFENMT